MAIKKITIQQFIELSQHCAVLDVRSPGEFDHAHITGGCSLPLFSNDERKTVGTLYKQEGKQAAIKAGLDFFGVKMKSMVEEAAHIIAAYSLKTKEVFNNETPAFSNTVLVHCWRGGMRSAGVAWLLDLYGFDVYTLTGGYKAYRNWVLAQFIKDYNLFIIGGYTGSGKTALLEQLLKTDHAVINLESLANHKGSAFGETGKQPTQEMFENMLANELFKIRKPENMIWIEDESQRIGQINIPQNFWLTMRKSPVLFLDIPFYKRLDYLVSTYQYLGKEALIDATIRIQKRLGPQETKAVTGFFQEENYKAAFEILLHYYDKAYNKSLDGRKRSGCFVNNISSPSIDAILNTEKLLACCITQNT